MTDSGLGFGKSGTAGSGIGLSNIRERLQLLYGSRASLEVAENPGGGMRGDDHRAVPRSHDRADRAGSTAIDA